MVTEFSLDERLFFPKALFDKEIDNYFIVLAPENPNWIVLSKEEYAMFSFLRKGITIRQALESFYKDYCQDEDKCIDIMSSLLSQINDSRFYEGEAIKSEEPVETIEKKVHIGTTNGCNMRCPHCYMAAGKTPLETIDLDKTLRIVNRLHDVYGELEVVVSGGEPLTYMHIEKLLRSLKGNRVILFTNGSLITEKNIDLISECCNEVQISFEGVSRDYYSSVRGASNYDKALHALELLKMNNVRIVLAVTILPSTLEDVDKHLIEFVKRLDYFNIEVRINDEIEMSGNALTMDMSHYDRSVSGKTIIKLIKLLREMGCAVQARDERNVRFTNCGIGTNVVINYDGKIYPCHRMSTYWMSDDSDPDTIIEEFNRINSSTSNDFMPKCLGCELRYICSGGCRIDNLEKNGSMTEPICDEEFKEGKYRKLLNDYRLSKEDR